MPTKGRAEQATRTIQGYLSHCSDPENISFSLACNSEHDMPDIENAFPDFPTTVRIEPFHSKIAAYNAIPTDVQWDIVLGASDDMWCVQDGWDQAVREAMETHFPDTNGCLWFSDGRQDKICTFSIMGRKSYEATGYLYHPEYLSYWCDNEWTEVMEARNMLYKDPRCLFKNEHPTWGGVMPKDDTYRATTKHFITDKNTFFRRKAKGFP